MYNCTTLEMQKVTKYTDNSHRRFCLEALSGSGAGQAEISYTSRLCQGWTSVQSGTPDDDIDRLTNTAVGPSEKDVPTYKYFYIRHSAAVLIYHQIL